MGDYLRCTDLRHIPPGLIEEYDAGNAVSLGVPTPNNGHVEAPDNPPMTHESAPL
jgi:hypothetical protein